MRLQADSEESDQTARKRRLIWVFAGCTCDLVENVLPRLNIHLKKKNLGTVLLHYFI